MNLDDPVSTALLAADAFARAGCDYALYGGLMLAAYGEPRETRDADLAVADLAAADARAALEAAGLETAIVFEDVRFGGLLVSRLSILGGDGHTGLNTLDLVRPRSHRYRAAAIGRSVWAPLRGTEVYALTAEDFVVFKALSTRERDLEDAATVVRRMGRDLDAASIDREVAQLGNELPDVDVRGRLNRIRALAAAS